jgi:hypothetical protein
VGFCKKRKYVNNVGDSILQWYLNSYLKSSGSEETSKEFTLLPNAPAGMPYFHIPKREKYNHQYVSHTLEKTQNLLCAWQ